MPVDVRSAVYRPAPVTFSLPSGRIVVLTVTGSITMDADSTTTHDGAAANSFGARRDVFSRLADQRQASRRALPGQLVERPRRQAPCTGVGACRGARLQF